MLERLEIRNYVLIKSLILDFPSGFSVLTGETGSGKSIILGALSLLLGEKAHADMVRYGEKEASISALFTYKRGSAVEAFLKERELDGEDSSLIIQRVVRANGRSLMSVNGISVSLSDLEKLGHLLVDVSSQHAHQSLMRREVQLSLLDKAAHNEKLLSSYKDAYQELSQAIRMKEKLQADNDRIAGEVDYMRFCLDEMDKADLKEGEDDELSSSLKIISQSESLCEEIATAQDNLRGGMQEGAISLLERAHSSLERAGKIDPSIKSLSERLETASIEIEDLYESLRDYLSHISYSPQELEEKQARLAQLQRLKKKYGGSLETVIKKREEYREKLSRIENFDALLEEASAEIEKYRKILDDRGEKLSMSRVKTARALEKEIGSNLRALGLKNSRFTISVEPYIHGPSGADSVVFLLSSNKGEKEGPISQIASGGELSRIMLAIKCALNREDEIESILFDEIDAGLGGVVATSVAAKLEELSASHQVIAITHLAQIATKADTHFLVSKKEEGGRTLTSIEEIEGAERIKETARLLSGEASGIALEHARSLLEV